jgi:hypothetical protein
MSAPRPSTQELSPDAPERPLLSSDFLRKVGEALDRASAGLDASFTIDGVDAPAAAEPIDELTPSQRAICANMGCDPETFIRLKKSFGEK